MWEAAEGSSPLPSSPHTGRTSWGWRWRDDVNVLQGTQGRKSRAKLGCLRSGGPEDPLARVCMPQAAMNQRAARMLTPRSCTPTSHLCTQGSGPTRQNSQAFEPLPGAQGLQQRDPTPAFSAGDGPFVTRSTRPCRCTGGAGPGVFSTLVKCGRRAPALSFPLRQKRQESNGESPVLGVCQGEAERQTGLRSGHCCAERRGPAPWGAGVPPTPSTTSSQQSHHILGPTSRCTCGAMS